MRNYGKYTEVYLHDVNDDRYIHFTTPERAKEIIP